MLDKSRLKWGETLRSPVQAVRFLGPGFSLKVSLAALAVLQLVAGTAVAGTARIAVASNFREAAGEIGAAFEAATGHDVVFSFGSTGQLFVQITQGAPFDVFLAADQDRAEKAVEVGLAVEGSRFTYATGRIVLFSMDEKLVVGPEALLGGKFTKLAIAEPASAPYGSAAIETLRALDSLETVKGRIVRGLNISQAYQFVRTGNAELGFVALSQIAVRAGGSRWVVPQRLHTPIAQDAVLLRSGVGNSAAKAFLAFLREPKSDAIRKKYGYKGEN